MSKHSTVDLIQLRQLARRILHTDGTAIAPGSDTPAGIDETIDALAKTRQPEVDRDAVALLQTITDADLARRLSDQDGDLMAAYGDAGYFVGLAMGLELAALTFCQIATVPVVSLPRERKGGRR